MSSQIIFHVAFPVKNITETKKFYVDGLACKAGRETAASLILALGGHQLVAHVTKEVLLPQKGIYPRHFGLIFTDETDWHNLALRAKDKGLKFFEEPKERFVGKITEHKTFFLEDPFYNLLEFKFYKHSEAIFGAADVHEVGDSSAEDV